MGQEFKVSHVSIGHWERGLRTIPGSVLKLMDIYEERGAEKKK